MSDIFNEIDEEVRREQFKKLWDRYQGHIIAGAVLIILLVAGWRVYHWWEAKQAAEAGAAFQAAMALSAEGKQAEAAFAKVSESGLRGYRDLARLQAAAALAKRDPKAAAAAYDAVAADTKAPEPLRDLAVLRGTMLLLDSEPYENIRQRLEPLAAVGRTFRNNARELLALSAWRGGDAVATRKWLDMIVADGEVPPNMRQRVEVLMALAAESGKS